MFGSAVSRAIGSHVLSVPLPAHLGHTGWLLRNPLAHATVAVALPGLQILVSDAGGNQGRDALLWVLL